MPGIRGFIPKILFIEKVQKRWQWSLPCDQPPRGGHFEVYMSWILNSKFDPQIPWSCALCPQLYRFFVLLVTPFYKAGLIIPHYPEMRLKSYFLLVVLFENLVPNNACFIMAIHAEHDRNRYKSSSILQWLILLFLVFGLSSTSVEALAGVVRPVWFNSQGYYRYDNDNEVASFSDNPQENETSSSLPQKPSLPSVIFLHGRLEKDDDSEPPFEAPAKLYYDFCKGLAKQFEQPSTNSKTTSISTSFPLLMIEYDKLLAMELPNEPRTLDYGPVSTALANAIETNLGQRRQQQQQKQPLVLVSFSMGASMALKLLRNSKVLQKALTHVILVEPVWRCWLPFCVSSNQKAILTNDDNIRILALCGTKDDQTMVDSVGSVMGSLKPLLPTLEVLLVEGGNHWGILTESVVGTKIAREGMSEKQIIVDDDGTAISMIPKLLQTKMIDNIVSFCDCPLLQNENRNNNDNESIELAAESPAESTTESATDSSAIDNWGGQYFEDAQIAARLVSKAVELCLEYQPKLLRDGGRSNRNNKESLKLDGTPVTALDYAIQAYILYSLKLHETRDRKDDVATNVHRYSFVAEEDAASVLSGNHQDLLKLSLSLARSLDPNLKKEDFIDALRTHQAIPGSSKQHRSWILDPIDGTQGLLEGKGCAIGLALCLDGEVVVGVLGIPDTTLEASSRILVAVKGHGIKYYGVESSSKANKRFLDRPQTIPGNWHNIQSDNNQEAANPKSCNGPVVKQASMNYPPYLVSTGPKTKKSRKIHSS